jgi:hypothetical protein
MFGAGIACWLDFTRHRGVPASSAALLALAFVLTPSFVFLATSTVMADCVFTCVQLAAVIAIERAVRRDPAGVGGSIVAGVIASLAFLVRATGLAVLAAGVVYLLCRRRHRQAGVFALTAVVCITPWLWYAQKNAPTYEQRVEHGGTIAYTYPQLIAQRRPGLIDADFSGTDLVERVRRNATDIMLRNSGAIVLPMVYRGPSESGEEVISVGEPGKGSMGGAPGTMILSALVCLAIVIGIWRDRAWLSLPVLLMVATVAMMLPVGSQTMRYAMPLTPFLWLFLWRGLRHPAAARVLVLSVLGYQLIDHAMFLHARSTATAYWTAAAQEAEGVLDWMSKNLSGPGTVASSNPGLIYLRTGRRGVASAFPERHWQRWKESGIRYVVTLQSDSVPPVTTGRKVLLQTKGGLWIVEM